MASPTVLTPLPVLSSAFSTAVLPSVPSSRSPFNVQASSSAKPSTRTIQLHLPPNQAESSTALKDVQTLKRSLTILLTPPQALPEAIYDGQIRLDVPAAVNLQRSNHTTHVVVRSGGTGPADLWDSVRLAVERGSGALGGVLMSVLKECLGEEQELSLEGCKRWLDHVTRAGKWWYCITAVVKSVLLPLLQSSPVSYPLQWIFDDSLASILARPTEQAQISFAVGKLVNDRRWAIVRGEQVNMDDMEVVEGTHTLFSLLHVATNTVLQPLKTSSYAFYAEFYQQHYPVEYHWWEGGKVGEPSDYSEMVHFTPSDTVKTLDPPTRFIRFFKLVDALDRSDQELYKKMGCTREAWEIELKGAAIVIAKKNSDDDLGSDLIKEGFPLLMDLVVDMPEEKGKEVETGIAAEAEEGLRCMVKLLQRDLRGFLLSKPMGAWVKDRVEKLIKNPTNDSKMVPSLLHLRSAIADLLSGTLKLAVTAEDKGEYEMDKKMRDAASSAFQSGMGGRKNKPAEMIAKEIDVLLRSKATSASTVDDKLDSLLTLVRYTRDKDVFRAFYVTSLAKRLLLNRSSSEDAELKMINRLKKELGDDFTSGDGMLSDLKVSESVMKAYRDKVSKEEDLDLSVNVLSAANWPSYPVLDRGWENFRLPTGLGTIIEKFKATYISAHQGRSLEWRYQLFSMTLKTRFASGVKELGVSLWQALALMTFGETEQGEMRSFMDIQGETGIETEELQRTLQSLACGKERVLVKHPKGRDVNTTDSFSFNDGYTSERYRVKINQIQQVQTKEEDDKTESRVMHDRSHLLDAAIVRIMKARKHMGWNELTNAVVDVVRNKFPPEPKAIKIQIESLIEREYLERGDEDESGKKSLTYLA